MNLEIRSLAHLAIHRSKIDTATNKSFDALRHISAPIELMRQMKFEKIGVHPVYGHPLNLIEQINQTFTFLVALNATEWLLKEHPDAGGFRLAPGAHASQQLDIMSIEAGLVGAETFAAVSPKNNRKLGKDLEKLSESGHKHRYAFFYAPGFPAGRVEKLERELGIQVRCVEL